MGAWRRRGAGRNRKEGALNSHAGIIKTDTSASRLGSDGSAAFGSNALRGESHLIHERSDKDCSEF